MSQSKSWSQSNSQPLTACTSCAVDPCPVLSLLEPAEPPLRLAERTQLTRGQLLVGDEPPNEDLWIVIDGVVMLQSVLFDGRRQVTGFRFPGEMIALGGEGALTESSLQAVCDSQLCRIRKEDFARLAAENPRLLEQLLVNGAAWSGQASLHMLVLGRLTAPERIATFLLEIACRARRSATNGTEFPLPMTRDDIADYLGLNPETVSRNLTRLRKAGVIDLPRPGLAVLRDSSSLAALTPFEPATCESFGLAFARDLVGVRAYHDAPSDTESSLS